MYRPLPRPPESYWPQNTQIPPHWSPMYAPNPSQSFAQSGIGYPSYGSQQLGGQSAFFGMQAPNAYGPYSQYPFPPINRPPGPFGMVMNSFKTPDGQIDMNKTVNTFGQLVQTFHSAAPLVKQVGSFLMK